MITILHVIDTTGPGGAESIFIELSDRMRCRGYRCIPLIRGPGWVKEELERRGLKPELIDAKGSFNLAYLGKLLKLIRRERVDRIYWARTSTPRLPAGLRAPRWSARFTVWWTSARMNACGGSSGQ